MGPQMTDDLFNAAVNYTEYQYSYKSLYNNSLYAKLALGRTAYEIRTNVESALNSTDYYKFVLFSGHDTTLMPILAGLMGSNWDGKWVSYASMVSIEIYNSSTAGSPDLFRIIYNGQQQQVPGCASTGLCNVKYLLDAFSYGQEDMPCDNADSVVSDDDYYMNLDDNTNNDDASTAKKGLTTRDVAGLCIMSAVVGALIGCSLLVFYQRRKRQSSNIFLEHESNNALTMSLNKSS